MPSHVTALSIKSLVKALRQEAVPDLKHTQVLDIVAESLGWKTDVLMHGLKQSVEHERKPGKSGFNPAMIAANMMLGRDLDAYQMAQNGSATTPGQVMLKAMALFPYEPNAARSYAAHALTADPELAISCLVLSDNDRNSFSTEFMESLIVGNKEEVLEIYRRNLVDIDDPDDIRLMIGWCATRNKFRCFFEAYPHVIFPYQLRLPSKQEQHDFLRSVPINDVPVVRANVAVATLEEVE